MESKKEKIKREWLEEYLNIGIISGVTKIQDIVIALAKKVEKLEKWKTKKKQ